MSQTGEYTDNHKTAEGLIPSNHWGEDVLFDKNLIEQSILNIQNDIVPYKPRIIAVTKYYGLHAIITGYEAGLREFGESRAQEAVKKIQELPDEIRKNSTFHFIGHLQTNKVEKVVEYFDYIDSVDSLKLAREISKSACRLNKSERILLQVNNAGEEQKSGYSKQQLREDFPEILKLDSIEICGLMNMAPIDASGEELSALFADVRKFRDELENEFEIKLPELSMGMTNDYKFAVKEGATMIRLGRKLFTK